MSETDSIFLKKNTRLVTLYLRAEAAILTYLLTYLFTYLPPTPAHLRLRRSL